MIDGFQELIDVVDRKLRLLGISSSEAKLDHVGYKCSSAEDYLQRKQDISKDLELVYEGSVRGSNLGIFKYAEPIKYKNADILGVEFIMPKDGEVSESFWEHVEYVVSGNLFEFVEKHPNVTWDTAAIDKSVFPKVAIRFENGTCAKFHVENVMDEVAKFE